jgi:threonine aldolase
VRFYSDNNASACPEIMAALVEANQGLVKGYGDDRWTQRLDAVYSEFFGTPLQVFPLSTGTAANSLALGTVCPPWGAVYAHEEAHIVRDECSAPEFFTGGARIVPLQGPAAKVTRAALEAALDANPPSVHTVQPTVLSITQATELGAVYRPQEVSALASLAHGRNLILHMDGARLANAVVFLGCHPGDVTWRAGVDVLSFGATKNGALTAEALIFFQPTLVREFELRRKRAGHLLSKLRYLSAQLLAYVESGAWQRNAARANALAREIGAAAADCLLLPVEANEVFARIGEPRKAALRARGFEFYDWGAAGSGVARFVSAWDTPAPDVAALCAALREA